MLVLDDLSELPPVRVRPLPGVEACLALWTAEAPEPEPLAEQARAIRDAMSAPTRRTLRTLDSALPGWPLRLANTMLRTGPADLPGALHRLAAEPPPRVAADLMLGAGGGDNPRMVERLADHPETVSERMHTILSEFCRAGFGRTWARQQSEARHAAGALAARIEDDPCRALAQVSPRAVHDPRRDRLIFLGGADTRKISCARLESLDIHPSRWLRRRVALTRTPTRAGIGLDCTPDVHGGHDHLAERLAALGNEARLQIIMLCLERPRTTSELAPLLNLTEAPVSRHLKTLERAGLVERRRSGPYVAYSTVIEALHGLGAILQRLPQQIGRRRAAELNG
jgi:DNA-binding transcriptional ArsR family regulator